MVFAIYKYQINTLHTLNFMFKVICHVICQLYVNKDQLYVSMSIICQLYLNKTRKGEGIENNVETGLL